MPYRKTQFAIDEYYHICGRGHYKQNIFREEKDFIRFLFLILHLQADCSFPHINRNVETYIKKGTFGFDNIQIQEMCKKRFVELTAFCLMNNHYHLLVKEVAERGISRYMQKILNAYTKYFNTKYDLNDHLFGGPFRATHIKDDGQLLYVSAYIHLNPREMKEWRRKEEKYPWSSYQDYVFENRWDDLLKQKILSDLAGTGEKFKKFTEQSGAKEDLLKDALNVEVI